MSDTPAYNGSIVLKASSKAEVSEMASLLDGFAEWGEPFGNKYESGAAAWCIKGKVVSVGDTVMPVIASPLQQAAERGALERQISQLERDLERARHEIEFERTHLLAWLTEDEKSRALMRSFYLKIPESDFAQREVLDPMPDAEAQRVEIMRVVLEYAAQEIERRGPDDPLVNLQAAGAVARLVRSLVTESEGKQ